MRHGARRERCRKEVVRRLGRARYGNELRVESGVGRVVPVHEPDSTRPRLCAVELIVWQQVLRTSRHCRQREQALRWHEQASATTLLVLPPGGTEDGILALRRSALEAWRWARDSRGACAPPVTLLVDGSRCSLVDFASAVPQIFFAQAGVI